MTKAEWMASDNALVLLMCVAKRTSQRKQRLLGCACGRRIWEVHRDRPLPATVLAGEAFADGLLSQEELDLLWTARGSQDGYSSEWAAHCAGGAVLNPDANRAAVEAIEFSAHHSRYLTGERGGGVVAVSSDPRLRRRHEAAALNVMEKANEAEQQERATQAILARDILGNPFHAVAIDSRWLTEAVHTLATGIYADRAFDRMPILADALEEAGCDSLEILNHCRGDGPHVRGCWVVDLVLGKE